MMKMKSIYTMILAAYILSSLLIPLASINKALFVVLIFLYGAYLLVVKKKRMFECLKFTAAPVLIITVFGYGFIKGIFNGADMAVARQFLLSVSIFALIYPISEFDIDLNAILIVIAKIYIFFFAVYVINAINLKEYDIPWTIERFAGMLDNIVTRTIGETLRVWGGGWMSYRSFFDGKGMMIYIGSISFIFILISILYSDFFKTKKISNLLWVLLGMVLACTAGQRTLMLFVPIILCAITWFHLNQKMQIISVGVVGVLGILALFYLMNYSSFFSLQDRSNSVKIGHVISYFEQLDLKQAILGDGLATCYYTNYSPEKKEFLAQTEVTLLDHCRYFGIPLTGVVWGSMLFPRWSDISEGWRNWPIWQVKEETVVLLLYFVWAQLNPVLFNSFGLVVVLWYWNLIFRKTKKEEIV